MIWLWAGLAVGYLILAVSLTFAIRAQERREQPLTPAERDLVQAAAMGWMRTGRIEPALIEALEALGTRRAGTWRACAG